jgi:hypothetical protein
MIDKKRQIKFFTLKYIFMICVVFAIVSAVKLYGDYQKKGYLQTYDFVNLLVPLIPLFLIVISLALWNNRKQRNKK